MKKQFKIIKNQNGVAIVWTLLFSMIFLVITTTLTLLIIKGLRITATVDQSNRAYLAAESGMERAMFELKRAQEANINFGDVASHCNSLDHNNQASGIADLTYSINATCYPETPSSPKKIVIESTGVDRGVVNRKIKTEIVTVDPTNKIQKFDPPLSSLSTNIGWSSGPWPSGGLYNFPISSGVQDKPLIIQQFDLIRVASLISGTSEDARVGLTANNPSPNWWNGKYYYLNLTRYNNSSLNLSFSGSGSIINDQTFRFSLTQNLPYRIIIEYAEQGNNYSVLRAIALKRKITGSGLEKYVCIDSNNSYVVYSSIDSSSFQFNPTKVIAQGRSSSVLSEDSGNGFILLNGKLRVDNMVFWGKE